MSNFQLEAKGVDSQGNEALVSAQIGTISNTEAKAFEEVEKDADGKEITKTSHKVEDSSKYFVEALSDPAGIYDGIDVDKEGNPFIKIKAAKPAAKKIG